MSARSRYGVIAGGIGIVLSSLCLLVIPVFTPAIVLAVLVGALGGTLAIALQARRTAFLAFTFALTPLFGLLAMQYSAGSGYVAFIPWALAVMIATSAFVLYARGATAR